MDEELFDLIVRKTSRQKINQIQHFDEPCETFTMTPLQASVIEKELNTKKDENIMGYLLVPIRREDQILYKPGMNELEPKTFAEEQDEMLMKFYKDIDTVKNKITSQEFHCFLTLEQLRRHNLARYFMSSPDPLYLKLYDYRQIIGQFLDIRQIASRLLKRKYKSNDDFEIDMVTMIQNFRIYFLKDIQMLDISIKFQMLFWDIYTNEEKVNKEAMETFKYYKQRCKVARSFRNRPDPYTLQQKKELVQHFNSLSTEIKKKILLCLEVGPLKKHKIPPSGPIDLSKMKNSFFVQLDSLLKKQEKGSKKAKREMIAKQRKRKEQNLKKEGVRKERRDIENQIYFSDEQSEEMERRKDNQVSRQAIQEVMDLINMEEAIFGSDDDD